MTVNVGLLDRTVSDIEANPEGWNQNFWNSCFAGRTVAQAKREGLPVNGCGHISDEATSLLGLNSEQAVRLFFCNNDLASLQTVVAWIKGQVPVDTLAPSMPVAAHSAVTAAALVFHPQVTRDAVALQRRDLVSV